MKHTIDCGVNYVTVDTIEGLHKFVGYISENFGAFYRGQRDAEWGLETTLDRYVRKLDKRISTKSTYSELIQNFRRSLRCKHEFQNSEINEDDLWSLGQHYGLATPLLDWTSAFFIALFFAFEDEMAPPKNYRCVWGIHQCIFLDMEKYSKGLDKFDEIKKIDPLTNDNMRLISQSGVFTKQPIGFDIESWVKGNYANEKKRPVMYKVMISEKLRRNILSLLEMMNISYLTIFPDVIGAAKYSMHKLSLMNNKVKAMNNTALYNHVDYKFNTNINDV